MNLKFAPGGADFVRMTKDRVVCIENLYRGSLIGDAVVRSTDIERQRRETPTRELVLLVLDQEETSATNVFEQRRVELRDTLLNWRNDPRSTLTPYTPTPEPFCRRCLSRTRWPTPSGKGSC